MKSTLFFFAFLFGLALSAQPTKELYLQAGKAYKHKDYPRFLELTRQLDSIRPSHPNYTFNLACGYALTGKPDMALAALEKCIMMDSKTDFENEPDLASLKTLPGFERLIQLKLVQEKLAATSEKELTLDEKDLHPEGVIYLKKGKKWLVASVRKGKIVTFDDSGKCTDWLKAEGMLSVMSMKADADEKYLWVATVAMPELSGYSVAIEGKAEILKVNIKTKTIEQRFSVEGKHIYGDLIVAKNGTVYVSDSLNPVVYRIQNGGMIEWLRLQGHIYNLQGLTFDAGENKIYLADYFSGILEIPLKTPENSHWLAFPKGTVEKGIDGLHWHNHSLIAIHNGVSPIRIIQYFLDETGNNITKFKIIDNNRPEFNEPAMGCFKKGRFYFFANNPWQAYDKKQQLDQSKFANPMLYSFSPE